MNKTLRSYLAELVATFAFVFISAGAVCAYYVPWSLQHSTETLVVESQLTAVERGIVTAFASGCIYAAALAATLTWGGGYHNPAITLTLWVYKRMDTPRSFGLI
jgi:glycerol uptake facilitator protein